MREQSHLGIEMGGPEPSSITYNERPTKIQFDSGGFIIEGGLSRIINTLDLLPVLAFSM